MLAPRSFRGRIGLVSASKCPLFLYPKIIRYTLISLIQSTVATVAAATEAVSALPFKLLLIAKSNPSKNLRKSASTLSGFAKKSLYKFSM